MTVITKAEQEQLEKMGWQKESYNMKNNDRDTKYEGWVDPDDLVGQKSK